MSNPKFENTVENHERSTKSSTDRQTISGDHETSTNRRDESQIISDQDLTNEHSIQALDSHMGALSTHLEDIEDEPEEFIQGEVDVVTQMRRTTRAMDEAIDQSEGRKAHPKHDTFKNQ